ncbi:MAG TPA: insulinase family protein [Candidatus Saccharimonadales bacterium]|nr:insulinase family protein [Candidatus Saccharimonadales bacterium]
MNTKSLIAVISTALLMGSMYAQEATKNDATKQETSPKPAPATSAGVATNWKQIAIPTLPPFKPQEPKRIVFPNGIVIFLTENHELPLISGSAMIRGGAASEPASKTGLVELYGATWRTGGTTKLSGDQLDDYLEARAAKVETSGSEESTSISFNCLKGDFNDVLGIFVNLMRNPAFREDKLALAKKQMNSSISRRNDESEDIASMQQDILGYGKQSAYARVPEYATVAAVTHDDLLQWHKQHTTPNNIIFGVVGDFDSKEMEATLRKVFGDWVKGEKVPETKVAIAPEKPGIYVVDKSDVNQSEIRMIGLGIVRKNPDYYALQVMNEIFGGGFSSRLFSNLRTKAGLAYSVGGGVGSGWDHQGLTVLEIGTKTETTTEAIKGLWEQVDLLKKEAPTELELKRAKDAILNSFIFNFDTPAKVLREQETYEFYGYPRDFLEQYRNGVEKVTAADVLRVANKYVHKDELKVLVVGNASEFTKQLATLGTVTPIDITIPTPEITVSTNKATGNTSEGKAAVAKFVEAMGGANMVNAVKTLHQSISLIQQGMEVKLDQSIVYPDKQAQKMTLPQGEMKRVVTPSAAFMAMGAQVRDLPPSERSSEAASLKRDFLNVLQHAGDSKYTFSASGKEKLGDAEAIVVEVNADGAKSQWWIGPDGKLLQEEFSEVGQTGPTTLTMKYSDWKSFDGLQYPTKYEMVNGGQPVAKMTLSSMEVNAAVDPKLFEKPAQVAQ